MKAKKNKSKQATLTPREIDWIAEASPYGICSSAIEWLAEQGIISITKAKLFVKRESEK